ncbi:MAG TPA: hypothetical protein IAB50_04965 [Candidatus Faecivicinus avistercoris]|nr:hypothetical protein [Candidatus Faecivicinus avistercoris]
MNQMMDKAMGTEMKATKMIPAKSMRQYREYLRILRNDLMMHAVCFHWIFCPPGNIMSMSPWQARAPRTRALRQSPAKEARP